MSDKESPVTETPTPTVSDDVLVILPVRNIVLFPGTVLPISMNREASIAAAQEVVKAERKIGVLLQHDADKDDVTGEDLHRVGTVASVLRYVTGQDGAHHLVLPGRAALSCARFSARTSVPHGARRISAEKRNPPARSKRSRSTSSAWRSRRSACCHAHRGARERSAEHRVSCGTGRPGLELPRRKGLRASAAPGDTRSQGASRSGVGAGFTPHRGDEAATEDRRADAWRHRRAPARDPAARADEDRSRRSSARTPVCRRR